MPVPERTPKTARVLLVLALAIFGVLLTVASFQFDDWTRTQILAAQGKGWKKSTEAAVQGSVSRYGDWPWLMALGGAGLLVAWRLRNRDWQRILISAMIASTLAGMLVNTVRLTTGRTRPNAGKEITPGWYGPVHDGRLTIGNPKYNAFPSGHTATAVGFAGVLLFARPFVGGFALLVALGIGWSRMLLGAHHPSDVTVAALIALLVAWICWRVNVQSGDRIAAWVAQTFRRKS